MEGVCINSITLFHSVCLFCFELSLADQWPAHNVKHLSSIFIVLLFLATNPCLYVHIWMCCVSCLLLPCLLASEMYVTRVGNLYMYVCVCSITLWWSVIEATICAANSAAYYTHRSPRICCFMNYRVTLGIQEF